MDAGRLDQALHEIKELEAENKRLREENERLRKELKHWTPQFYTCTRCGQRTDDLVCCYYDEEGGGE